MTRQVRPKVRSTLDHDLPLLRSAAPVLLVMTLMVGTSVLAAGNDAKRFAGTLRFDKTGAGGPKVGIEFDATLVKEVSSP